MSRQVEAVAAKEMDHVLVKNIETSEEKNPSFEGVFVSVETTKFMEVLKNGLRGWFEFLWLLFGIPGILILQHPEMMAVLTDSLYTFWGCWWCWPDLFKILEKLKNNPIYKICYNSTNLIWFFPPYPQPDRWVLWKRQGVHGLVPSNRDQHLVAVVAVVGNEENLGGSNSPASIPGETQRNVGSWDSWWSWVDDDDDDDDDDDADDDDDDDDEWIDSFHFFKAMELLY